MIRRLLAAGFVAVLISSSLAACDGAPRAESETTAPPPPAPAAPAVEANAAAVATPAAVPQPPAANGAPAFAVLYPGARVAQTSSVSASGPAGPGGMSSFTVAAEPAEVIAFYRQQADAAGLASVMAMDQGGSRAYGAAGPSDAQLQVVASPQDGGGSTVLLTWSAGR
ncbi:hypothetical protein [Brevundimonas sp.]|uniref:hypothetical protein n=1 Tax=Brevundimonas sp. TaxID=1871086 RepID=UPI0025C3557C|nr:hypothetical protein [Brevundimonas sp.]